MTIDIHDVRIDTFQYAIQNSPYFITITHLPTGCSVKGEGRGYHRLWKNLFAQLDRDVVNYEKNVRYF